MNGHDPNKNTVVKVLNPEHALDHKYVVEFQDFDKYWNREWRPPRGYRTYFFAYLSALEWNDLGYKARIVRTR
jgi:hypothetical protein